MAHIRVELLRGTEWTVRQEGEAPVSADELAAMLPAYALQYAHRAYLNGRLVAEVVKPNRNRRAAVVRHDA